MSDVQWAALAILLLLATLVFCASAMPVRADTTYLHGIVQDVGTYQGVGGGHVWLERQWGSDWPAAPCCDNKQMQGHSFQFYPAQAGRYRVMYQQDGYEVDWIRYDEFTLPEGAPFGDIQIHVKRVPVVPTATPTATSFPVPTTLYPPTVDPTATSTAAPQTTPTPNAAVSYITLTAPVAGTVMAFQAVALAEYVPASCFEIAATQEGCPLSVTQSWIGNVDGACWKFQPFSCPWRGGIELVARCESPCEVGIIPNGDW